jgi:5-methylthioadenosine/S-adenosylhomocysteine deaminase
MYDIAIKNGLCYIDGKFTEANIGISGNRIAYVGKSDIRGEKEIDASSNLVLPGLFNAHTHLAMTLFRGYAEDMPLMDWLKTKIWRAEKLLTEKDVYWGSILGILEMIKTGTTGFSDLYIHMDEVAKAVGETGIRSVLCYGMADRGDPERGRTELEIGQKFIESWQGSFNGRIKAIFGPHAPYTCSLDFLRDVKSKARELSTAVHIHVSETKWEVDEFKRQHGSPPVEVLNEIGFLDSNTVIAHGVWLSDEEIRILAEKRTSVVHNPVSNLKLASGIANITKMIQMGVKVCLGTDGAASNNTYNLFEEVKLASLLQKVITGRADAIKAYEVLEMATLSGYRAYKIDGGKLESGKLADLILLRKDHSNYIPAYNPLYSIVYSTFGCEVTHTIVDGEILMEDRMLLTIDEDRVKRKVEKIKEKFEKI